MSSSHVYSGNRRRHTSLLYIRYYNYCHSHWCKSIQLISYSAWGQNPMGNSPSMGARLHFPIYGWRTYRNCFSQFFSRHCSTRHILCRCSLPLCSLNGSCICNYSGLHTLIPPIYRLFPTQHLNENPLRNHIYWRQPNFLPPALLRFSRDTSTLL